jgi:phospholipase C
VTVHSVAGAARLHHLAASAGGEAARQGSPDIGEIAMTRLQSIEHFVVLMLENRSFDNLLGGLYPKSKDFDGVDGSESNTDRSGKVWHVTEAPGGDVAGLSVPSPDPGELWQDINVQIFGSGQLHVDEPCPPREGAVAD